MTLCSIIRKAKIWKIISAGSKIAKRELTDESKSVSSLFMNNEKVLPRRALTPQKPSYIRLFRASEITPTQVLGFDLGL